MNMELRSKLQDGKLNRVYIVFYPSLSSIWRKRRILVLSSRTSLYSAGEEYILLKQGTVKLMRSGQSHILTQQDLKLKLFPGDRIHTGSETRVEIALKQGVEIIELFSHAFLEALVSKFSFLKPME